MGKKLKIADGIISGTAEDIIAVLDKATKRAEGKDNDGEEKPYVITSASIKEELCNYGYEIRTGPCAGDKIPTRKGSAVVHHDMIKAFSSLNVHLAIVDDVFKYSGDHVETLEQMRNHDLIDIFSVTGFKIQGSDENEGFVLVGEKWVSHGSIGLETPKITTSTNYPFFEELKEAIEKAREEVEAYMNGKAAPKDEQPELPFPDGNKESEFDKPME